MIARKKEKVLHRKSEKEQQEKEPGRGCWRDERPGTSTPKASSTVFFLPRRTSLKMYFYSADAQISREWAEV